MRVFKGFCAGLAVGLTLALWVRSRANSTPSAESATDALNTEFDQLWRSRPAHERMASHLRLTRAGYQLDDAGEIIGKRDTPDFDEDEEGDLE